MPEFLNHQLNWAAIADLHFGEHKLPPDTLYLNLVEYLYPKLEGMDILFIPGDLFDSQLTLTHLGSYYAMMFISDMVYHSERTGMKIRIVDGTYSHDRNQSKFIKSFTKHAHKCNCRIITEIEVETIKLEKGVAPLRVVYLPDSLPYGHSNQVIDRIMELFQQVGWTTADVLLGHGSFAHALPEVARTATTYSAEQFDGLIDGPIIMGHIHVPSRHGKVMYTGSFERLAHGEEGKKGFLTGTMDWQRKWSYKFVENKKAIKFITLSLHTEDHDEVVQEFRSLIIQKFPTLQGHVRVLHADATIRSLLHQICNAEFPKIRYTSKTSEALKEEREIAEPVEVDDAQLVLDLPTLTEMIYLRLRDQSANHQFSLEHYQAAIAELGVVA